MFGSNASKVDKKALKVEAVINKYGLNDFKDPKDQESVLNIANNLAGLDIMKLGIALSSNATENAKVSYLSALVEQNFIIMRQLERIANK